MEYGLIGAKLSHSFSPQLHALFGRYEYGLLELTAEELGPFLGRREFRGLNVTMPYKQAVIPYLDELSEAARETGAVNTIVNRGGSLYGDNTDLDGLLALLRRTGLELSGRTVLILGTGGTSRTAFAAAKRLGAGEILRLSRREGAGDCTYDEARLRHKDAQILVNTTPTGMHPDNDGCPIDLEDYPKLEGVIDAVYNPLRTNLVQQAQSRGIRAAGGLYMLVRQAAHSCELFTGKPVEKAETERVYRELLRSRQNLVLIGMPSSGKTTVGRLLAERLGLPFSDVDEEIIKREGRQIPEIFSERGEAYFRKLEADCIRSLAPGGGRVIASGGGSILSDDNLRLLRQNGLLLLLDRSVELLTPSRERPLAASRKALRRLYAERRPRYLEAADRVVPGDGTPEQAAEAILCRLANAEERV